MRTRTATAITTAASIVAACGGGGGDGGLSEPALPPPAAGPTATLTEGLYQASSAKREHYALVLEGGETWIYKQSRWAGDGWFFAQGTAGLLEQTSSTSGTATAGQALLAGKFGSDAALISNDRVPQRWPVIAMTLRGGPLSFTSDPTADGKSTSLTFEGQPKLQLATPADDGYDYQKPASLANLPVSRDGVIKVDSAGVISSDPSVCYPSRDCVYDGALTPRPSGKNVFNLSLTVSGDRCTEAGSYRGVAYQTPMGLELLAIKSDKTEAVVRQLSLAYICF